MAKLDAANRSASCSGLISFVFLMTSEVLVMDGEFCVNELTWQHETIPLEDDEDNAKLEDAA
jgi:hypothetical protein